MTAKPPPKSTKMPPKSTKMPPKPVKDVVPAKKFSIATWDGKGEGEKIMIVGASGRGKSSLAMLLPNSVFLGLDDGARKLRHPVTGEPPRYIPGIENFWDVRAVLQNHDLFNGVNTITIDTVTVLQDWAEPYTFATVPASKGSTATNIEAYGYGKGYKHLFDTMKCILQDCDSLVRKGKNIVFIAQNKVAKTSNESGEDYLCDGPNLSTRDPSIRDLYCEWVDHVLRIDYLNKIVEDKKVSGTSERAIFTKAEPWFTAKSRTVQEPVISFESPADDSIWKFIFGDDYATI